MFKMSIHSLFLAFFVYLSIFSLTYAAVNLTVNGTTVQLKNDLVELNFKSDATIETLYVNGTNIASTTQTSFYLDWSAGKYGMFWPSSVHIVEDTPSRVHFYWLQTKMEHRFDIELHYILEDGFSGIYCYAKYINNKNVTLNLGETRMVFRFKQNMLRQGTNSIRTGTIPNGTDFINCTRPQDATYEFPNGTYYTKYDYVVYIRETHYQGVYGEGYGAFVISPSREYHGGGAMKQDITVHEASLITNYFASGHFGFPMLQGIPGWQHIYGPFLIFFTTGDNGEIVRKAENQVEIEKGKWPYLFVNESEYPLERGSLSGYISGQKTAAVVVYDAVDEEYDIQQSGYLFTNQTDSTGYYEINKIRPGTYRVVAYPLAGHGSENLAETNITITAGHHEQVNFTLPEPENILWSLGEANRRSSEFKYSDEPRNFKWESYPPSTVNFTIGVSDPKNDWYYAQTKKGHWYINYQDIANGRSRILRIALAGASMSVHVEVKINGKFLANIYCKNDHAVYRSAMQSGRYHSYVYSVPADYVVNGTNILNLYAKGQIMYDVISLQLI